MQTFKSELKLAEGICTRSWQDGQGFVPLHYVEGENVGEGPLKAQIFIFSFIFSLLFFLFFFSPSSLFFFLVYLALESTSKISNWSSENKLG